MPTALIHGDCLAVMPTLDAESIDAVVTDPPYDLLSASRNGSPRRNLGKPGNPFARHDRGGAAGGFMGKAWDGTGIAFRPEMWAAAFRIAKPGAYLLAFGGTRTVHRMTCAIEDAGWIIRDMLVWAYASGFPKGKANLKPAYEPIVLARKPGPLRPLAIDACRIGIEKSVPASASRTPNSVYGGGIGSLGTGETGGGFDPSLGRWPSNLLLTDPIFDGGWDGVVGGGEAAGGISVRRNGVVNSGSFGGYGSWPPGTADAGYGDSGTYSRFFLIPKASRSDREPVVGGLSERRGGTLDGGEYVSEGRTAPKNGTTNRANVHPTVKPTALMRHLVRLVTPPGGIVLDPFLGSGTTALACEAEGFGWVGIEREEEYVRIAEARLALVQRGLGLGA